MKILNANKNKIILEVLFTKQLKHRPSNLIIKFGLEREEISLIRPPLKNKLQLLLIEFKISYLAKFIQKIKAPKNGIFKYCK